MALTAGLSAAVSRVPTRGRAIVLQALRGGAWRRVSTATTGAGGRATWPFTLAAGRYRLRAVYGGGSDLAAAASAPVTVRVS